MRIVLDTNALIVSIPAQSEYRPIFDAFLDRKLELAISNDILTEYVEVLTRKANEFVASNIAELLLNRDNVVRTEVFFSWKLISKDEDDNKFVDCAIASNANFLVSNDRHFQVLTKIQFPNMNLISIEDFLEMMTS